MSLGTLVTEEEAPKAAQRVVPRADSSQALVGLLALARKADAASSRSSFDLDKPADPLAGIIARPVLRALLGAMQYRSPAIVTHGRRTARLAVALATQLGWERTALTRLELAALLHGLGRVGVPDNILSKPDELSADEAGLLAVHHGIALDVLAIGRVHHDVVAMIAQSQPHADLIDSASHGSAEVSLGARILAVAEAFDMRCSEQPFRAALTFDEALRELSSADDPRIDGSLVKTLSRLAVSSGPGGPLAPHASDADLPALSPDDAHEAAAFAHIFSHMYILESLYDGFTLVDGDLRFVLASRGASRLLGRPAAELHRKSWASHLLPTTDPAGTPLEDYDLPLNRVLAASKPVSRALRMQSAGGGWLDLELQAVPLTDETGRLLGVAEIFRSQCRTAAEPPNMRELKLAASRDPLTGLANRGELEAQLTQAMKAFKSSQSPFAVLFLDVDFFKQINDNYGHAVGDQVLVGLAKLLRQECYSGETLARYGGEEFVVVCPETDLPAARRRAERLRLAVSQSVLCPDVDVRVTASFGVATVEPKETTEALLLRADKALYNAKKTGRNRTCSLAAGMVAAPRLEASADPENDDPFVFATRFKACLAADIAAVKLGGFLRDGHATLGAASPGRAVLKLGRGGLFGGWGTSSDRQPVEVRMDFGDPTGQAEKGRQIIVRIEVRPRGRVRDSAVFKARAADVVTLIRSYFAGTDA